MTVRPWPGSDTVSPDGLWRWEGARWVPQWSAPPPPEAPYRSAAPHARLTVGALGVFVVAEMLTVVADARRIDVLGRVLRGDAGPGPAPPAGRSERLTALAWLTIGALVLAALVGVSVDLRRSAGGASG
jgi:hypothetical protein